MACLEDLRNLRVQHDILVLRLLDVLIPLLHLGLHPNYEGLTNDCVDYRGNVISV